MIQLTGVIDVYFEDQIEILVADEEEFSSEAAQAALREAEIEFTQLETRSL